MTSPYVLVAPRMMVGSLDIAATAVSPEFPVLNISSQFDSVVRLPGAFATASITVQRTVNASLACQVPWSILQNGANPVTAAYFKDSVFPSGTLSFAIGESSKTITVNLSQGDPPSQELTGKFQLGTPVGAALGPTASFTFSIAGPLAFPTRLDPSEPGWVNIPSFSTAPNKQNFATVADMQTACTASLAGQSLILTDSLDAAGATFTLDADGTTSSPVFLRGNSDTKAAYPELSNATIILTGTRWVICRLRLRNVRIIFRDATYTQIQQCRFSGYNTGGGLAGAISFENARYTLIQNNDFVAPFKCAAVYGGVATNYKYIWIRNNKFKDFTDDASLTNSAISFGPNATDATFDAHIYIANNLFKDYVGNGYVIDTGVAGVACFDNTFEVSTSTSKQWIRIRQGATKPVQYTGNIIDGNLWVSLPEIFSELPTSTTFVNAANYAELVTRLNSASAGTCITLTGTSATAYAGSDITKTLNGTADNPIVIRGPATGTACGTRTSCPKIPFNLTLDGSYIYLYGIDFNRGTSSLTNGTTLSLDTSSDHITIRRCWFYRKFGNLIFNNGTRHTIDFCDLSVWGVQEFPTTDGNAPADSSTKANWLPSGPFQCISDGGNTSTRMTIRRNYFHDCPYKQSVYSWHTITCLATGYNPTEALEEARWLIKENLVWKGGHMDIAIKTSYNVIQGNTIDGASNKCDFNQRAGNYNEYLSNWYETGTYTPPFSGHGGYNMWIGNRLPSGKSYVTQCGDHAWDYQYLISDPSDREHQSYNALYWGNIGNIQDGYRDDDAKTVVATRTQIVPTTGQTYTNLRATNANTNADPPTGYTLVPAVKLTAGVVGPGAAWVA